MKKPWQYVTASELAAIITALIILVLAIITRQAIFSPGLLNARTSELPLGGVFSHQELSDQCGKCHAPPWSTATMADRCLDCHTEIMAELQNPHELHSRVLQVGETWNCIQNCHTEHRGEYATLTLISAAHFYREQGGFSLEGHLVRDDGFAFECVDCHPVDLDVFDVHTCETCHQNREAEFMVTHVDTFGTVCLQCHDGIDTYGKAFNHYNVEFPLEGKHNLLPCSDCHQGAQTIEALKETPQDCYTCHSQDDKHEGRLGQDCAQCHDAIDWRQPVFNHDETNYPLTGSHTVVACTDCHAGDIFKGTPTDCYSCHRQDDNHKGTATVCDQCHSTSNWRQISFDHNQTGYSLTGKHISATCSECHAGDVFESTPMDCYSCHRQDDNHKASQTDCSICHNTSDWRQVNFEHSQTEFQLTGRHSSIDCIICHTDNTFVRIPTNCYSCHAQDDVHNGSFGTNCNQCHNTTAWQQVTFDHNQTAFPLTGAHSTLSCNSCHSGGVYAGTPTDCYSCHARDDAHDGSFGTSCNQCHNTTAWLPAQYNLPHTFPINHHGANSECSQCHPDSLLTYTCYAGCHKHTPSQMASRHRDIPNFGDDCVQCHPTGR